MKALFKRKQKASTEQTEPPAPPALESVINPSQRRATFMKRHFDDETEETSI